MPRCRDMGIIKIYRPIKIWIAFLFINDLLFWLCNRKASNILHVKRKANVMWNIKSHIMLLWMLSYIFPLPLPSFAGEGQAVFSVVWSWAYMSHWARLNGENVLYKKYFRWHWCYFLCFMCLENSIHKKKKEKENSFQYQIRQLFINIGHNTSRNIRLPEMYLFVR